MGTMHGAFVIVEGLLLVLKNNDKFPYHGTKHTLMVMEAVVKICEKAGISQYMTQLILIAAAWHDVEQSLGPGKNERESGRLAGESLRRFGYCEDEIILVKNFIRGTETWKDTQGIMHQLAEFKGKLEKILADADLCSLWADEADFVDMSIRLMAEMGGKSVSELSLDELMKGWGGQFKFMIDREFLFLTEEAVSLIDPNFSANMSEALLRSDEEL